jgi:hypothetical protein
LLGTRSGGVTLIQGKRCPFYTLYHGSDPGCLCVMKTELEIPPTDGAAAETDTDAQ